MASGMRWDRASSESVARARGAAKDQFDKEKRYARPMTYKQREYLNVLRERHGMEPVYRGLSVYDACLEIDRLKRLPVE